MNMPERKLGGLSPEPDGYSSQEADADDFSVVEVVTVVLKRRRLITGLVFCSTLLIVAWSLTQDRLHVASGKFVPATRSAGSSMGGVAAQFGFRMPSQDAWSSPKFYGDLLHSRAVLDEVAATGYIAPETGGDGEGQAASLYDILADGPPRSDQARNSVIRKLRGRITVEVDRETGVVSFDVVDEYPDRAEAIAGNLLEVVNRFNVEARRRQAQAEQEFVEDRMVESRARLVEAEQALKTFLNENRVFDASPELVFQHDRLAREVNTRQEVYLSLAKSLEQSRIDAIRNTPVITRIEDPSGSARPQARGTVTRGLVAAFLSGLVGLGLAFALEFNKKVSARTRGPEYSDFDRAREATVRDLTAPFRWIRRAFSR